MSEEPIVTQLKKMVEFLIRDMEYDIDDLKNPRYNWRVRWVIRRQVRRTKRQIDHYLDKIDQYENDAFD